MSQLAELKTAFVERMSSKGYALSLWKMAMLGASVISLSVGGLLKVTADDQPLPKKLAKSTSHVESTVNPGSNSSTESFSGPKSNSFVGGNWQPDSDDSASGQDSSEGVAVDKLPQDSEPLLPIDSDIPAEDPTLPTDYSPLFLKGGFGFFMGFCIGFALRVFLRIASFIVGANLLMLLLFAYIGWVEVHWDVIQAQLEPVINNLGIQLSNFKSFVAGAIPMTMMSGVGLAAGLKKK